MNPNQFFPRRRWYVLAALALLVGGTSWVVAESAHTTSKRSVDVKVDNTPLSRQVDAGLSFSPIVKRVIPSVVKVVTVERAKELSVEGGSPFNDPMFRQFFGPLFGNQGGGQRHIIRRPAEVGLGSGVIVSPDGYILTNNHVVDGADSVKVTLSDGREFTAKVIGTDKDTDIAVIKIDAHKLPAITFADSNDVQVGDRVLAVGNPFGIGETVTSGIVSATGRTGELNLPYEDFIQTDAAINPGNSGGALVDMKGRLIGLNTAILSRSGGFQGIGFAIPSDLARHIMNDLVTMGKVVRGYLGVTIQNITPDLAGQFGLKSTKGVLISDVKAGSPAAKAGLQSGDVVVDFNGKPVPNSIRLQFAVAATDPGTTVPVKVMRNGKEKTVTLTVGQRPGSEQLASGNGGNGNYSVLNGVSVADLDANTRNEFDVPPYVHGALVTDVDPSSASALAGLHPGDVIEEIDHHAVRSANQAVQLTEHAPSPKTLLKLWSHDGTRFLVVDESNGSGS